MDIAASRSRHIKKFPVICFRLSLSLSHYQVMSSATEVKLLTLLNVSAVKRPRELDLPGGHRGSPSASPVPKSLVNGNGHGKEEENVAKRPKSVVFAGEVGPSGSHWLRRENGEVKGKGKAKVVTKAANGHVNGLNVNGHQGGEVEHGDGIASLVADDDRSDDDGGSILGE